MSRFMSHGMLLAFAAVSAVSTSSCLSACFGSTIGEGAARLSVRQAGALTALVNADSTCGFASDAARASEVVEGEPGGPGRSIIAVRGCAIDVVDFAIEGCTGSTFVTGKLVVDAVRTLEGTVTGRSEAPILPAGPDAVAIDVSARVESLRVVDGADDNVMTQTGGTFSFTARPRLAADVDKGLCSVPTSNVRIAPIVMTGADVTLDTPDLDVTVRVASSSLDATNGLVGDSENVVSGSIEIDGQSIAVRRALNDTYDRATFEESFACNEELAQPVDFDCGKPTKLVAGGAARLAVQAIGKIVATLQDDDVCGFAGRGADEIVPQGEDGVRGVAVWRTIDCAVTTSAGTLLVSATKSVRGRLTGDALTPVIPEESDAVILAIEEARGAFIVETEAASLLIENASLSGMARPRLAIGEAGICTVATAHASVEANIARADATLITGALRIPAAIEELSVRAVNGRAHNGVVNRIEGGLVVDDERIVLGAPAAASGAAFDGTSSGASTGEPLVSDFDEAAFDAAVNATPGIRAPASFDCDPRAFLALQAARLLINNTGDLAARLGDDEVCGFGGGLGALITPDDVADLGDGTAVATIETEGCAIAGELSESCVGDIGEPIGLATFDASLFVTGLRVPFTDVVLPNDTRSTRIVIERATLDGTGKRSFDADGAAGPAHLVATGDVSAVIEPSLAQGALGLFDVGTPVAHIEVRSARLDAVLFLTAAGDVALPLVVEDIDLRANNGPAGGVNGEATENTIAGSIVVDGLRVDIAAGTVLVPGQTPASFDASFVCGDVNAPVGRD